MFVRVAVVCACVIAAGILGIGRAAAEDLGPDQARAFVVGKLFSYTCFEGTAGMGRIFADGSVVGTIRFRGQGQPRFAQLPAGTIRVEGTSMCAHLSSLPITPCFRVQKIDYRSFRGSIAGLGFAYCDFHQNSPRTRLTSAETEQSTATPIAAHQSERAEATPIAIHPTERAEATPIATRHRFRPAATPIATLHQSQRPAIEE